MERLLSVKDVIGIIGISRSGLYGKIASGEFPKPVAIGQRAVRFRETDVQGWIDGLEAKRGDV